jgi:general secretion pathway protein G
MQGIKLTDRPAAKNGMSKAQCPTDARCLGFTLIELMLIVAVSAILAMVAIPAYQGYIQRSKMAQVMADMTRLDTAIEAYRVNNESLPENLSEVFSPVPTDAWGNAFVYLRLRPASPGSRGAARKDHNLVPINSDYDLYSKGADGRSVGPLTARHSRDDIVRANDGAFIGAAADY